MSSEDSDLIILKGSKIIVDLKFDKDPADSTFSIYDQEKVFGKMKSKYPQLVDYEDYLPTVAAFLGCDYIPRMAWVLQKFLVRIKRKASTRYP
jgi:5'-3' exonuclease